MRGRRRQRVHAPCGPGRAPGPGRWVARCHDRSLGLNGAWAKGHMRLGPWFLYITFNNREAEGEQDVKRGFTNTGGLARLAVPTPPDSLLVLPRIFLATPPLPARSPLPPCEPARRNVEPPMVRPAPQPPCAHPSTRRRLRPASHCLPAAPFLWAAGGGVQRPQARCPRARTGSTSRTTTCRSPACRSPSSATPTRTPRPGPSSTTRATASSAPAALTASSTPNPRAHCGAPTRFRVRPLPMVRTP